MSEIIANLIAKNRTLEKRLNYLETQESGGGSGDTASGILTKLLTVDGTGSGLDADTVDGYHASAFGLLGSANTWTQNNYFSANVGIGTTSPGTPLEVYMTSGTHALRLNTNFGGGNYVDLKPYIYGVSNAGFSLALNGTDRLVLSSSGNVGIGTTSPDTVLEIANANAIQRMRHGTDDAGTMGIEFTHRADSGSYANLTKTAIVSEAVGSWGRSNLHFVVDSAADTNNYAVGTDTALYIQGTTRNVGIGTTSPYYGFTVHQKSVGLVGTLGTMYMEDNGATINFTRPSANYIRATDAAGSLIFATAGSNRLTIGSAGHFTFASPSTAAPLLTLGRYSGQPTIRSSDTYLLMDSNGAAAGLNYWSTDPVVLAYGNGSGGGVAIGQTTVASGYKLDVNGAIKSSSFWYQATSDARIYINAGGTLRFLDASSGNNLKLGIGITPQGQFHNFDGTGGTVHITQSNITSALLITDGTGDIAYGAAINWVCRSSAGITQAGIAQVITPSSSYSDYAMFNAGGNTMVFRIYSDGRLYLIRTAGSASFYVSAHITYL